MSMQMSMTRPARRPSVLVVWAVVLFAAGAAIVAIGRSSYEGQMYLVTCALVAIVAALVLPKAVARDGKLSVPFVATALALHLIGSLFRYFIIQTVYHGVADANGYYGAGKVFAPLFRSLQFPALKAPYFGTPFVNWSTGILFAIIGTSMLGGFVVHSALAFVGGWYFYKAFRVAFPEGDAKLFAWLVFFLPSMWYWPSSLGKDSLVVTFLGLAAYGFAHLFRGVMLRGVLPAAIGVAGAFMIRPPIATALMVAAAAAFILRPTRGRSPQVTVLMWLITVPILALIAFYTVTHTAAWLGSSNAIDAFQENRLIQFHTGLTGSNFTPPNALSPLGFPMAVITTTFRPFPWEAGGLFPTLTSLEGVLVGVLIVSRRREILRGLRQWRSNGMVLFAAAAYLGLSVILSSLANFGLLARERTQVLPFLFMLVCMVKKPRRAPPGRQHWPAPGEAETEAEAGAAAPPAAVGA